MCMAIADTEGKHWTAADLRAIPEDRNRYEIIDGELFVTPSPCCDIRYSRGNCCWRSIPTSRLTGSGALYMHPPT